MNQNGWELKDFLIILVASFIALLIAAFIYKKNITSLFGSEKTEPVKEKTNNQAEINNSENIVNNDYRELENKIKIAAERYQNDNYQGNLESKETWILTYKMLKEKRYLKESLIDQEDKSIECNGYVEFKKDIAKIAYTPYIKCGNNYQTKGYDASHIAQ